MPELLAPTLIKAYAFSSDIWNEPAIEELLQLPSIAEIRKQTAGDRLICMHFMGYHTDWYIAGFDPEPQTLYGCVASGRPRNELGWTSWELPSFLNYLDPTAVDSVELTRNMSWGPPMRAYDPRGPIWPVEEAQRICHMRAKQKRLTGK